MPYNRQYHCAELLIVIAVAIMVCAVTVARDRKRAGRSHTGWIGYGILLAMLLSAAAAVITLMAYLEECFEGLTYFPPQF